MTHDHGGGMAAMETSMPMHDMENTTMSPNGSEDHAGHDGHSAVDNNDTTMDHGSMDHGSMDHTSTDDPHGDHGASSGGHQVMILHVLQNEYCLYNQLLSLGRAFFAGLAFLEKGVLRIIYFSDSVFYPVILSYTSAYKLCISLLGRVQYHTKYYKLFATAHQSRHNSMAI